MKISLNDPCPCGSGAKYKQCCRAFHQGTSAPSPEALMRSRYTAYALNELDFIMATTHPDSPYFRRNRGQWRRELEAFSLTTRLPG